MALELTVPKALRGLLRLGTCSWKYDSWKGLVYDRGKAYGPNDYLPDYARFFGSVEVDQWFWSLFPGGPRLPDPSVARLYAKSVPDDFVFTVKAPNSLTLTHHYAKQTPANAALANTPNPAFLDRDLRSAFPSTVLNPAVRVDQLDPKILGVPAAPHPGLGIERLGDLDEIQPAREQPVGLGVPGHRRCAFGMRRAPAAKNSSGTAVIGPASNRQATSAGRPSPKAATISL